MQKTNNNLILIPLYKIKNISIEHYNKYQELVNINVNNMEKLNINASIKIITKNVNNLRDMWFDILGEIITLTKDNNNVLYMEADTLLFNDCSEIFLNDKVMCFGLGYWNMSFKEKNEFNFYEYLNSGLVYFPSNCNFSSILNLYNNWPEEGDLNKLKSILPKYNFNFGNRVLDYSGTFWEYICNILYYSQFSNKQEGINYIANNFGIWKYNYRGCLYKKYPHKSLLPDNNIIYHAHFLIHSSNKDKNIRFNEILNIFKKINTILDDKIELNKYILSIPDDMF